MDYEKAYKEALKGAKSKIKNNKDHVLYEDDIIEIFPELKENEDERIRKELYDFCIKCGHGDTFINQQADFLRWAAWLEKQGVQEESQVYETEDGNIITYSETDGYKVVEPKFKVGDWVVENEPNNYARFIQILETVNVQGKERYRISRDIHNDEDVVEFDFVEKYYHKFDIKDAKDGDVLQLGEVTAIFKKYIGNENCICYCSFCEDGGFEIPIENGEDNVYGCYDDTTPATKEQCDLLLHKMKEAGYEWDADKKELKNIEDKPLVIDEGKAEMDYCFTKMMNGEKVSSAWSEEDKENLNQLHKLIIEKAHRDYEIDTDDETLWGKYAILDNWLKSLKERVQLQWKPSEEQLNALNTLNLHGDISYIGQQKQLIELYEQLKKL